MFWRLPNGNGEVNYTVILLLGISTWAIYIADRLLDIRLYPPDISQRHLFHSDNKKILIALLSLLIIGAAILCFYIPIEILQFGVLLSMLIGVYLFFLNKVFKKDSMQWLKEPTTAICYVLATVGVAFIGMPVITMSTWVLAILFFLIASQNLLVFSFFELKANEKAKNTVSIIGFRQAERFIRAIGVLVLFVVLFLFSTAWYYPNQVAVLLALMALVLSVLPAKSDYFAINDRYRWVGDGIFLLPIVLFLF